MGFREGHAPDLAGRRLSEECRGHWSSDLSILGERRRRVGHEILPLGVYRSGVQVSKFSLRGIALNDKGNEVCPHPSYAMAARTLLRCRPLTTFYAGKPRRFT